MTHARSITLLALPLLAAACGPTSSSETDAPEVQSTPSESATLTPDPTETPTQTPTEAATIDGDAFRVSTLGCAMSHCDTALSDTIGLPVPSGDVSVLWHDEAAAGSNYGLGCSSNSEVVACSMGGNGRGGPYLKVYDADGNDLWSSDLLGFFAFSSAPVVSDTGEVIAADTSSLIRFSKDGDVIWQTETDGGLPISPVLTDDGTVVLATLGGPVSVFDLASGALLESLVLDGDNPDEPGTFNTRNTPCVAGNRVYVSTEFLPEGASSDDDPESRAARLWAIDVDPEAPDGAKLQIAWHFEFGARSGSSPTCADSGIYFDGDRIEPGGVEDPHLFALNDLGDTWGLRWRHPMPSYGFASPATDPRGGVWAFGAFEPWLLHLDKDSGEELLRIDLDALVGEDGTHVPLSAMSVGTGPDDQPILMVTAAEVSTRESFLTALDLSNGSLLWKVRYGDDAAGWGAGQFPVVLDSEGESVVVFTTAANGIIGVNAP